MKKHRFVVLSDLHVGSIWGLWQPLFETMRNNVKHRVMANEINLYLYKCFKKLESKLSRRNIRTVFLNGDIVDGPLWRSRSGQLVSEDLDDQVMCASELLYYFLKKIDPETVYQLHGTDYHNNRQIDLEKLIARELGIEFVGLGPYDFNFGDLKVNIAHGGGSTYWYRGTKMDKTLFALNLCKADSALYDADFVIRSHYHFAGYLEYPPNQYIAICPCFQAQTDYMRTRDAFKMVPTIGALEVTVDKNKFDHRFYLYDHPPRPAKLVNGVTIHPKEAQKSRRLKRW